MKRAGIAELKASLSEYLDRVQAGEEILVTDRGRPIARLIGVEESSAEVQRLIRRGILRPPAGQLDVERIVNATLCEDPDGRLLRAILDERESGW